ncbi:MAG: MFS transporter [Bacteroidales bacterium]
MKLTQDLSRSNYKFFLWHAVFLALAKNFMDVDTIIPAMMIDAGGSSLHVGFLTGILVGGSKFAQLFFASWINNKTYKKPFLLLGINLRVLSLVGLAGVFFASAFISNTLIIWFIFILITIFSVSGAFANISFTDILGKSVLQESRKSFFSIKQIISSIGVFLSAFLAGKVLVSSDYPDNYAYLFAIAAVALGIASIGFWRVKEMRASKLKIEGIKRYFQVIRKEIKSNKKFANYLMLINTQGIVLALMPFLILYAKQNLDADNESVRSFLMFKVIGGVIMGSLLYYYARKVRYQKLLYLTSFLSVLIPLYIYLLPGSNLFFLAFLGGGVVYTLHKVSIDGVLLEVSTNENRALYTGLSGAGSIMPAAFPLAGGWIVNQFGFPAFFSLFILFILISIYFVYKLNCKK